MTFKQKKTSTFRGRSTSKLPFVLFTLYELILNNLPFLFYYINIKSIPFYFLHQDFSKAMSGNQKVRK